MKDFQTRKNKESFIYSPLSLLVLFFVLLIFVYKLINLSEKARETHKKRLATFDQVQSLKDRENKLESSIEKLHTEEGTEETLRDKYHLVKSGEKMVVIVDEEEKQSENIKEKDDGFMSFWGNLID